MRSWMSGTGTLGIGEVGNLDNRKLGGIECLWWFPTQARLFGALQWVLLWKRGLW